MKELRFYENKNALQVKWGFFALFSLFFCLSAQAKKCEKLGYGELLYSALSSPSSLREVCNLKSFEEKLLWSEGYFSCKGQDAKDTWRSEIDHFLPTAANSERFSHEIIKFYASHTTRQNMAFSFYHDFASARINAILRAKDRTVQCLKPVLDELVAVIKKLELTTEVSIWRGLQLSPALVDIYRVGKTVTWKAFSSASTHEDVARGFSTRSLTIPDVAVLFQIHSKTCRSLYPFGYSSGGEYEVVCLPGMTVKVIHTDLIGNIQLIELEEVEKNN